MPEGAALAFAAICLLAICTAILHQARARLGRIACQVEEIKTADKEIVAYVLTYLAPLTTLGQQGLDPSVAAFVAVFLLAVVWTSHSYHFNPLLSLAGYHFYEITDATRVSYVLITRRSLRQARHLATVVQLSEYILLDAGRPDA